MDRCLAPDSDWGGVGCDNMTAMIIAIKDGKTTDEWYQWMKERVDSGKGYDTPKEMVDPFSQGQGARAPAGGRGAPPGSLSMALGGSEGEEDDGEELDLPAIQKALQARMAELARGGDSAGEKDEEAQQEGGKLEEAPKTSMSPPTTI